MDYEKWVDEMMRLDDDEPKAEYFAIATIPCRDCLGEGYVEHPAWRALFNEEVERGKIIEDVDAWFRERGFEYPPDQEIICSECGGTGKIETRVPLAKALEELGYIK